MVKNKMNRDLIDFIEYMNKEWKASTFWHMANKPLADEINQYFIDQGKPLYYFVTEYGQFFCKTKKQLKKLEETLFEKLIRNQETIINLTRTIKEIKEKEKGK